MARGTVLFVVCLTLTGQLANAADWRQFRGNNSDGVAADADVPVTWSDSENIGWKAPLVGRGLSGPIVIGDRVIVTSSSGFSQDRLHVACFDVASGDQIWERQFWATGRTMCHPKMCVATPTPASDGERVFVFYSTNDMACLDLDGNLLWFRGLTHDYPNASNSLGMSSSPVVVGDTLVAQVECDADSFAVGLDVETGIERWKISRPRRANWTSPVILRGADSDTVLLQASDGLLAVEPRSGETSWAFDGGASTIPSSVVSGQTVYVPSNGITALQPPASGTKPKVLWQVGQLAPSTPSPLVYDGRIFTIGRVAVTCASVKDGNRQWQVRVKGPFSASPVAAGGRLYLFSEKGVGQVIGLGEKGKVLAENDLGETILATPAVASDALFVRSDDHLWKISE